MDRLAAGHVARPAARPLAGGLPLGPARPVLRGIRLDAGAGVAPRVVRLLRLRVRADVCHRGDRRGPLCLLGLPAGRHPAVLLLLIATRRHGQRQCVDGGRWRACHAGLCGGALRHLPCRASAATFAAGHEAALPAADGVGGDARGHGRALHPHPRRLHRVYHEHGKGLLQRQPAAQPCRHQPRLQSHGVALQAEGFRRPVPLPGAGRGRPPLPVDARPPGAGPACGRTCRFTPRPAPRLGRRAAPHGAPRRGAGHPRELLLAPYGLAGRTLRCSREPRFAGRYGRALHPPACQQLPHRPRAGVHPERLSRPAHNEPHEISAQVATGARPGRRPAAGGL